jgi:GT2 family glycosyltransferase
MRRTRARLWNDPAETLKDGPVDVTLHDQGQFGGPQHQKLEVLSARALERGDIATAFRLSDRRCRIRPLADAHCFVLRAEALQRMGDSAAALADLETAIGIAPDDLGANRRLLNWGDAAQRVAAAERLIADEGDAPVLQQALAELRGCGRTGFARLQVRDNTIEGWAAWQGAGRIRIVIEGETGASETVLEADPDHPLSDPTQSAAGFALPKPAEPGPQFVSVMRDEDVLALLRIADERTPARAVRPDAVAATADAPATVIVPVYADFEATRACLASLLAELDRTGRHRAILVNDASPDPGIHALIDGLAKRHNVQVLTNTRNLGFVGAINRALNEVLAGDVILLNADTVVPHGFIDRLAAVARSQPDIGTVTPLSNNGEFTSFPIPNQPNPAGAAADVDRLDRIAARVNADRIVDIPNGIGFCLYITRACLDAVGRLSESYHRGYLEDVDFCLRARQQGLRNVCAASVYVGHAGSKSFGKEKRSLVVRNLKVLAGRFPDYRAECADFVLADPLNGARQAIEAELPPSHPGATLLVTGSGAVAEVAEARARQLLDNLPAVLVLEIRTRPGQLVARLRDAGGAAPQSLEFLLGAAGDATQLLACLRSMQLARMEMLDIARIPRTVVAALLELPIPHDILVAHAELGLKPTSDPAHIQNPLFYRLVVASADRLLVSDLQAEAVASSIAPRHRTTRLETVAPIPVPLRARPAGAAQRVGLVPVRGGPKDFRFMRDLIAELHPAAAGIEIIVTGSTFDDDELLRAGTFVTGPIEAVELEAVCRHYRLDRIVLCLTEPLFGHPLQSAAMALDLPVAYCDWSGGRAPVRDGDLPLAPELSAIAVAARLQPWLGGRQLP